MFVCVANHGKPSRKLDYAMLIQRGKTTRLNWDTLKLYYCQTRNWVTTYTANSTQEAPYLPIVVKIHRMRLRESHDTSFP